MDDVDASNDAWRGLPRDWRDENATAADAESEAAAELAAAAAAEEEDAVAGCDWSPLDDADGHCFKSQPTPVATERAIPAAAPNTSLAADKGVGASTDRAESSRLERRP